MTEQTEPTPEQTDLEVVTSNDVGEQTMPNHAERFAGEAEAAEPEAEETT